MIEPAHKDGNPSATDDNWLSIGNLAWRVLGKARKAQKAREKGADAEKRGNVFVGHHPIDDAATRRPVASATADYPGELEPHAVRERSRHGRRSTGLVNWI